jgi:hypothetical protein
MNMKYGGILVALMLVLSATLLPAIHGSKINTILETHLSETTENIDQTLLNYFEKMAEREVGNQNDILGEMQTYLSYGDNDLSHQFNEIYNILQSNMDEQEFNDLMSFMLSTLRFLNSNEMKISTINNLLKDTIKSIKTDLGSVNTDDALNDNFVKSYVDFFEENDGEPIPDIQSNSAFETYWTRYGKAKCYWFGYMPWKTGENEFGPRKIWNVNTGWIGLWSGSNFYDWHQRAVDYIIGLEEETGKSTFVQLMNLGIAASLIFFFISLVVWLSGFLVGNPNWILAGGGVALLGSIFALVTAYYLYVVLYYFLYGSNAYFEMQRYGNVEFTIHVINETGNDITSYITVQAVSDDASFKYETNEPVYPNFGEVPWEISEFEYDLKKVKDEFGNEEPSTFCLHSAQESPEKWKKAVPPPGIWSFTVDAVGYKPEEYTLKQEILPGECFNITIQLKEL